MFAYRLPLCALLLGGLTAAEPSHVPVGTPAATTTFVAPLSVEEAAKWTFYSQVLMVNEREKDKGNILFDTMDAKNQILIVHSVTYFKSDTGQTFAVVNYLRPRTVAK